MTQNTPRSPAPLRADSARGGGTVVAVAWLAGAACLTLALGYAWVRWKSEWAKPQPVSPELVEETPANPNTHVVTPAMEENVAEIAHRPLPDLTLPGTDGQDHNLGLIAADNPLVLVFIKEGCPCSLGAQPWFNQLFDAHGADARFFGIIDADLEQGKDWARKSPTPFPLLCDKSGSLMRAWNINSGGQLALIAKGGTIERLWPGFSNENLHSANQAIAQLRNVAPPTIDFEYAPRREITGCPYDFQTEAEPKP